jgi:hypothetical protein
LFRLSRTDERCDDCSEGGRRLCFFKVSRNTPRYVLAVRGREGCESLVKKAENEKADVVGKFNGKGIVATQVHALLLIVMAGLKSLRMEHCLLLQEPLSELLDCLRD